MMMRHSKWKVRQYTALQQTLPGAVGLDQAMVMTSFLPHAAAYLRKVSMDGEC
jgi:hypothetical protein